jgi:hypothetical protein
MYIAIYTDISCMHVYRSTVVLLRTTRQKEEAQYT